VTKALVVYNPTMSDRERPQIGGRPHAGFIAQLIATAGSAPQTRARHRAEPIEAATAYRAVRPLPVRNCAGFARSL
jgi:hypothetical protein